MKKVLTKLIGSYLNLTAPLFPKYNGALIFSLICKVQKPPLKPKTQAFFDMGETIWIPTSHKEVALHTWGRGEKKLLFLHGWQSNARQWQVYVEQLDLEMYTIYALDAPGHGLSKGTHLNLELYRETISAVVDTIGPVHTLIAHSLGSLATSYAYLCNRNIAIKSFIIMGSPSAMQDILAYAKELLSLSQKANKNLRKKIDTIIKIPVEEVTLGQFFTKVDKPTLVIHEKSDSVTPIQPIQLALKGKLHIQTLFTTGQDHMLKAQQTIDSIQEFIKNI